MKPVDTLKLDEWVRQNAARLRSNEFGSQAKAAEAATIELGFKASTNALRDLMANNGIETKRISSARRKEYAMQGEIDKLNQENKQLKTALAKAWVAPGVTSEAREFIFANLDDEIRAALATN